MNIHDNVRKVFSGKVSPKFGQSSLRFVSYQHGHNFNFFLHFFSAVTKAIGASSKNRKIASIMQANKKKGARRIRKRMFPEALRLSVNFALGLIVFKKLAIKPQGAYSKAKTPLTRILVKPLLIRSSRTPLSVKWAKWRGKSRWNQFWP